MSYWEEPIQMPTDLPGFFPPQLEAKAQRILAEARGKYRTKAYLMDAVRFVIVKMTLHFSRDVRAGNESVASARSHMGRLVDSILKSNCGTLPPKECRWREQEARKPKDEAGNPSEWGKFEKAIARADKTRRADTAERKATERMQWEDTSRKHPIGLLSPEKKRIELFTHSEGYRSITIRGESYSLTSSQAQIVEILHRAYEDGNPEVGIHTILEKIETPNSRWQDTFKRNSAAKKALITKGTTRGTLRLKL